MSQWWLCLQHTGCTGPGVVVDQGAVAGVVAGIVGGTQWLSICVL